MFRSEKVKKFILFLGDVGCLYLALFLMLWLRFGQPVFNSWCFGQMDRSGFYRRGSFSNSV